MTTATYSLDTTNNFLNPERGFMQQNWMNPGEVSVGSMQTLKSKGISILWVNPVLSNYVNAPLDQAFLTNFQDSMNVLRSQRMKCSLNFRYTVDFPTDATLARILGHMDQLQPYLAANADVILMMQAGWIGQWGEFANSNNFGDGYSPATLSAQNIADRKTVIQKCLSVMPSNRFVQLRAPWQKMVMFRNTSITAEEAWNGSDISRLGHYNTCILDGPTNAATYINDVEAEKNFISGDTLYVPFSGETCTVVPGYTECPAALADFARLRLSFLSYDFNPDVLAGFTTGGCMPEIQQRLGYRLSLTSFTVPTTASLGNNAAFSFDMLNNGFAPAYFRTKCNIILRQGSDIHRLPMNTKPRGWFPSTTPTTISESLAIPSNIPTGNYEVLIEIPDDDSALALVPEYSIRLANADTSAWEPATGFNKTGLTLNVTAANNAVAPRSKSQSSLLF